MQKTLLKGLEKIFKKQVIEQWHADDREAAYGEDLEDDSSEQLSKRNWPFFVGIFVFYTAFLVLIHFTNNPPS